MDLKELSSSLREYLENNKSLLQGLKKSKIVRLDVTKIIEFIPDFADLLNKEPDNVVMTTEGVVQDLLAFDSVEINWFNLPTFMCESIANIRSRHLGKLISVEGIIRQTTDVKHLIKTIKYECPSCGTILSVSQNEKEIKSPSQCSCGRKGGFREIAKDLEDIQFLIIEESHEDVERNNQPKRIKCRLLGSLCEKDIVKRNVPGTLVRLVGVLKEEKKFGRKNELTMLGNYLDVNYLLPLDDDDFELDITEEDEKQINELVNSKDTLDKLVKSIAPSIYGYEHIKKAMAFQLFGGVSKKRSDDSFTRENIHGLLVGDPSLGKSVFLRFMSSVTPRGRFISGKSSSGVGITAAVVKSELTGGWSLEAGSIVLANGSICGIDEGDKMSEEDRSNLHEAMSLGTITVAKASIQAKLPARTSILMAANPKHGRFTSQKGLMEQINLVPSLLSRFDFIYIMKDKPHEDLDKNIAEVIMGEHTEQKRENIIPIKLLRKYLFLAKQYNPIMTPDAADLIKSFYIKLRKQTKEAGDGSLIIPITPRQLESLIRLSEAHARIKLKNKVEVSDAKQAIKLMKNYLMEFGYDEKIGAFDIDKLTGTSSSTRTKFDLILKAFRELEPNSTTGYVRVEEIEKVFKDKIPQKEVEVLIQKLNQQGDLIKQGHGYKRI